MIVQGMPHADYLAIEAASNSGLQAIARKSPFHFQNAPPQVSPALSLGTLAHALILEPGRESEFVIQPKFDRRTTAGKMAELEFLTACPGKTVVSREDWDAARAMRDAVMSREHTRALFEGGGQAEQSVLIEHPDYGVPCKIRPDWIPEGYPLIVDLKTTKDASPRDFLRSCWTYGYQGQAWFYSHIMQLETGERHQFIFVVVESSPPHDVALYELSDRELADGEKVIRKGLELYRRCTQAGIWPGIGWDWESMSYRLETLGRED